MSLPCGTRNYTYAEDMAVLRTRTHWGLFIAFMILLFVWLVSRKGDAYWTVNGFLFALFIGGTMAIRANLMAADGIVPPSPESIIITYLSLVLLFVMLGDQIDRFHGSNRPDAVANASAPT